MRNQKPGQPETPTIEHDRAWWQAKRVAGEVQHVEPVGFGSFHVVPGNETDPVFVGLPYCAMEQDAATFTRLPLVKIGMEPETACGVYLYRPEVKGDA